MTGTADRIDEKESVTAVRVKGNAVCFIVAAIERSQGSLYSEKATGIVLPNDFSQELPRKIWEEKCLFILKNKMRHISKSEI